MKKKFKKRRKSLKYLLINTSLIKVNQCDKTFNKIGFKYSFFEENYIVFKIQYNEFLNVFYIFSKSI